MLELGMYWSIVERLCSDLDRKEPRYKSPTLLYFTLCNHEYWYATVKSMFSVWHGTLTANWRFECRSVVSCGRSQLPHRMLAPLLQLVRVHGTERRRASADRRGPSSLGIVVCERSVE